MMKVKEALTDSTAVHEPFAMWTGASCAGNSGTVGAVGYTSADFPSFEPLNRYTPRVAANDNVPRAHRYSWLKGLDGYAYLATVYSKYPKGRARATEIACLAAAQLMQGGVVIYSPIVHSHHVAEVGGIDPLDWAIWQFQNQPLMDHAAALVVLTMEGWQESVGVTHEIASFVATGRPVLYLAPGELGVVE